MPRFPHLLSDPVDDQEIVAKMKALRTAGVPYTDGDIETAHDSVAKQAKEVLDEIVSQQGPREVEGKEILSLIAYLQRLGTDIKWQRPHRVPLADQVPMAAQQGGE